MGAERGEWTRPGLMQFLRPGAEHLHAHRARGRLPTDLREWGTLRLQHVECRRCEGDGRHDFGHLLVNYRRDPGPLKKAAFG